MIKTHTTIGKQAIESSYRFLGESPFLHFAVDIVYYHHAKYDGSGYPEGLKGESIPLAGRIMALSDVYDALRSYRVYKDPWPHKQSREYIVDQRGKHFDPDIVDAFIRRENDFQQIVKKYEQ